MRCGSTPAAPAVTTRARGVSPCRRTASSLATTIAEAPSDSGLLEPAVTTPSLVNAGLSAASFSRVVVRGVSSAVSVTCSRPLVVSTGTISASKAPLAIALAARSWLCMPKASESSRVIPSSAATRSAVSPRVIVCSESCLALTNRHPSAVSWTSPGFAHGVPGLAMTQGARVIDSTPPATTTSASPLLMARAALAMAVRPLAQSRLTV